ncbi:hypothetical protein B0H13DRAFT_2322352 [Mycena leptocephala]|nr:hypothetical protein B0H13DRAFT_2322352 [Mycena leptocephala]
MLPPSLHCIAAPTSRPSPSTYVIIRVTLCAYVHSAPLRCLPPVPCPPAPTPNLLTYAGVHLDCFSYANSTSLIVPLLVAADLLLPAQYIWWPHKQAFHASIHAYPWHGARIPALPSTAYIFRLECIAVSFFYPGARLPIPCIVSASGQIFPTPCTSTL